MYSEVTSVYVPVKTSDYKTWAILLSLLGHGGLLAGLLFFNHTPPPAPMETMLVTPEELSQIEGQIRANQLNNAAQAGTAPSMADMLSDIAKPSQRDPQTEQMMQDITAKETAWRREQEKIAQQLDQEVAQEQQQVIDQLNAEQAEEQAILESNRSAEDSIEDIQKRLAEDAKAYEKDALPQPNNETKNAIAGEPISIKASNGGSKSVVVGGNGTPKIGGSSGNSANYASAIRSKIYNNWNIPKNSKDKSLTANIKITPSGNVISIGFTGSSASDSAFKSSLESAIRNSDPLPMPNDSSFYDSFKGSISLNFRGEN